VEFCALIYLHVNSYVVVRTEMWQTAQKNWKSGDDIVYVTW